MGRGGRGSLGRQERGAAAPCGRAQDGCVHICAVASQAGGSCICEYRSPRSLTRRQTHGHADSHKIRQVVGGGASTPCKRATHSCEGWVLDLAPREAGGWGEGVLGRWWCPAQAEGRAPAAGGSSLVRVCQRSRAASGCCRQSLQCFRASPRAPGPRDTPPGRQGEAGKIRAHLPASLPPQAPLAPPSRLPTHR